MYFLRFVVRVRSLDSMGRARFHFELIRPLGVGLATVGGQGLLEGELEPVGVPPQLFLEVCRSGPLAQLNGSRSLPV